MDKTVKIFDKQSDMAKLEKLRERKPYRLTKPIFNFLRSSGSINNNNIPQK